MKILIGIATTVVLFAGIKFLYRHFITDRIMDGGTGMENPAGPMLDYLSTDWEEPCGWRVTIDGYQMEIFFSDEMIYQGSFSFSYSPGEDINKKMQLYPEQDRFESENKDFSGVIEELYTEDGMMYLDIKFDKYKQENGIRRQVALYRTDSENGYDPGNIFMTDGDRTYHDKQALYNVIAGNWYSADGHWCMRIFGEVSDIRMILEADGSCVLETSVDYVYLMPNPYSHTELTLGARACSNGGEPAFAEVDSLFHEAGEGCGTLHLTVRLKDETEETITLVKQ
ncbi:MAG: hypothetical protein ACI4AB_06330 [Acetatifactor sp.]